MTNGTLRVAIIADYAEEGWPSMDLVADRLAGHLVAEHGDTVSALLVRPQMRRRLSRLLPGSARADVLDRITARLRDYPRTLASLAGAFDVYHIVDHSYAHLALGLPAGRTIVTCHDVDAFRSVLQPDQERRSLPYQWLTRRLLSGLRRAAHVACDSDATRRALISLAGFPDDALSVIPNGTDTVTAAELESVAEVEAARLLGPRRLTELLHVGSTIDRKRIDVLLDVFAAVRRVRPDVRLTRVGGPFTTAQRLRARDLGIEDAIIVLPFVDRVTLAAVYRRSALALLPSAREGFGLPVVEALACGTPVVASDIAALREVGGTAASYVATGDVSAWTTTVLALLEERDRNREAWDSRRSLGVARAAEFSWSRYASEVIALYRAVASAATRPRDVAPA
jgi:glycosyltransferase involved in cell wall biosynthesis